MIRKERWKKRLEALYKDPVTAEKTADRMEERFRIYEPQNPPKEARPWLDERDAVLITYGDTLHRDGEKGLRTLHTFLKQYVGDAISMIHILPMFPYSSDDGFSVIDYRVINPDLGTWDDLRDMSADYGLMYDAVINHVSKSSQWFRKFLECEEPYSQFFITCDPEADYHTVIRPRTLPLLTPFETSEGKKFVWTTFSADQPDLNYRCPDVLLEILDVLLMFAANGARVIRLDAIGFLWKEPGTGCMNLPETHETVKLIRDVLNDYFPGTLLITETNVPQKDNLSYFGNGADEADMVYQFPLPPLVLFTLLTGDASHLTEWASGIKTPEPGTCFYNFLSSHDGIGLRPTEGILNRREIDFLVESALRSGGDVSWKNNPDGTKSPYELNINYQDALASPEDSDETRIGRFLAAETILLSLQGLPGIYIHSLLGSRNDYYGRTTSGIPRRINREKLEAQFIEKSLTGNTMRRIIFDEMIRRLRIRREHPAFAPDAAQKIRNLGGEIFALERSSETERITVLINVTGQTVSRNDPSLSGTDLLSGRREDGKVVLDGYACKWILTQKGGTGQ